MNFYSVEKNLFKIIGLVQMVGAIFISVIFVWYFILGGGLNFELIAMFAFFFGLGIAAGITAIVERKDL